MSVIEFVGMPCSGKTTLYNKIKKQLLKKNIYCRNYTTLFYEYTHKIINLSIYEYICLYIGSIIYEKYQGNFLSLKNDKKDNQYFSIRNIKKKIRNLVSFKIENLKDKIIGNFNNKEKKFYRLLKKKANNSPINFNQKKILHSRIKEEIIGAHIYKKLKLNNLIILNDEGLTQRILSSFKKIKKKTIMKDLGELRNYYNPDLLLFVNVNFKELKKRSSLRKEGFKYNLISVSDIKLWISVFKTFDYIYKKNIYKVNDNNLLSISKKILEI